VEREHLFRTDPDATGLLAEAVPELSRALGGPDEARATATAKTLAEALASDGNPRVRAQVRALSHVLQLLESGDGEAARDLLAGELGRSFPGKGDLSGGTRTTGNVPAYDLTSNVKLGI
jgi:hypothetical protein